MKRTPLLTAILVLAAVVVPSAYACSCVGRPGTVAEEYAWADAVFEAEVVNIWFDTDLYRRLAVVTVARTWKGAPAPSVLVVTEFDSAACGIELLPGESWVVFATDSSWDGGQAYFTHLCTLSTPSAHAGGIIAELESVGLDEPTWGSLKAGHR